MFVKGGQVRVMEFEDQANEFRWHLISQFRTFVALLAIFTCFCHYATKTFVLFVTPPLQPTIVPFTAKALR